MTPTPSTSPRSLRGTIRLLFALAALPLLFPASAPADDEPKPTYVDEARLPEGWPAPGPFNQVVEKEIPAYRAAFSTGGRGGAFWVLFEHISRHDIPMTAPVEMALDDSTSSTSSMAFLYQNTEVGTPGKDRNGVDVVDVPEARVLSYTWQGPDTRQNRESALAALNEALEQRGMEATSFRLLGYNGPGTPRALATWEIHAILPADPEAP